MSDDDYPKIFMFVNGGKSSALDVVAIDTNGYVRGKGTYRSAALGKEDLLRRIERPPGQKVVWVDSPNDHPDVVKACELREERERLNEETARREAEKEAGVLPPETIEKLKEGHACFECVHERVCGVSHAIREHEKHGGVFVLSACMDRVAVQKEQS